MSITDELRSSGIRLPGGNWRKFTDDALSAIADRIDAEHRSALEKLAAQVDESERIGFDQGFASADDWLAQHEDAMAEHGWIRLPLDADGVPIRVGDRLEHVNGAFTANDLTISIDGLWRAWDGENGHTVLLAKCRHHHKPTVEDVLREFAQEMNENLGMYTGEAIDADEWRDADAKTVEKYAAKLRLAEGVDE